MSSRIRLERNKASASSFRSVSHFLSNVCGQDTSIGCTGNIHNIASPMRRASVSRRSDHKTQSSGAHPRSSERSFEKSVGEVKFENSKNQQHRAYVQKQETGSTTDEDEEDSIFRDCIVLPTLPRYPGGDSRDKNCWSEPDVSIFTVRGATYFDDNRKVQSAPYLFTARGSDIFFTDKKDVEIEKM